MSRIPYRWLGRASYIFELRRRLFCGNRINLNRPESMNSKIFRNSLFRTQGIEMIQTTFGKLTDDVPTATH